jgi:hypothetical protein
MTLRGDVFGSVRNIVYVAVALFGGLFLVYKVYNEHVSLLPRVDRLQSVCEEASKERAVEHQKILQQEKDIYSIREDLKYIQKKQDEMLLILYDIKRNGNK